MKTQLTFPLLSKICVADIAISDSSVKTEEFTTTIHINCPGYNIQNIDGNTLFESVNGTITQQDIPFLMKKDNRAKKKVKGKWKTTKTIELFLMEVFL